MKLVHKYRNEKKVQDQQEQQSQERIDFPIASKTIIGNQIYLYGQMQDDLIIKLKQALQKLNRNYDIMNLQMQFQEQFMPVIKVHIASYGGSAFSGMHMYDIIKNNKYPVWTYIDGFVASASTFPFLAGKKRFMPQNSYIMIHQLSTWVAGTFSNLKDQYESCQKIMNSFKSIYKKHLTLSDQQLNKLLSRDVWLNKEQALSMGFLQQ